MGLHIAILASAARGHRPRPRRARTRKTLRPIRPNHAAELRYRAGLLKLVAQCRQVVEERVASVEVQWPQFFVGDSTARDALPQSIDQWARSLMARFEGISEWSHRLVGMVVGDTLRSVDERLASEIERATGANVRNLLTAQSISLPTQRQTIDAKTFSPYAAVRKSLKRGARIGTKATGAASARSLRISSLQEAIRENLLLIKSIPEQYFGGVAQTLLDGWNRGASWKSMAKQIQLVGNVTQDRAKLIAEDQTSKMNALINRERQSQVGIESYIWSTRRDKDVRPSHRALDGHEFRWDSPPTVDGEAVHPGQAIRCRCDARPVVDMGDEALGYEERGAA